MKLVLDIEDKSYQTILDFISLLPENQCRVLPEETEKLNFPDLSKNESFVSKHRQLVLPVGTTLLVALTIRSTTDLPKILQAHLKRKSEYVLSYDCLQSKWSTETQFVEVTVDKPTTLQKNLGDGGVFIEFKGLKQTGVLTSSIKLPIEENGKNVIVDSLNYAFTRLSEQYEPWRKSHTGNVYDRILYREGNYKWYPIDVLRNVISIKKEEHQLVFDARQEAIKTIVQSKKQSPRLNSMESDNSIFTL